MTDLVERFRKALMGADRIRLNVVINSLYEQVTSDGVTKDEFNYIVQEIGDARAIIVERETERRKAVTARQARLEEMVADQEKWIKDCGGTLQGYIEAYGDPGVPRKNGKPMAGNGGTAIYNADIAQLERLKAML
jgi:hypothetical protein